MERSNIAFINKFAEQIKVLIKRKPRLVKEEDGGVNTIYY